MAIINGTGGSNVISGTSSADVINARGGDDVVNAGGGADIVFGGNGDDILSGEGGADYLDGGIGNDILRGGAGADVLVGGEGDDILSGGNADDTFVFDGTSGNDIITDFTTADTIAIDLGESFSGPIDLSSLEFDQVGSSVLITLPNGGTVLVQNATIADVQSRVQVACLLRGTLVATPEGEVAVETLSIGDRVTTLDGTAKRIKWIGRRSYGASFARGNAKIVPVVITAGALGSNTPSRDLHVSPDHAIHLDGGLVPAGLLVNGGSIRQEMNSDVIDYFHVEFEHPEVIFTNGAPTESYVDHGNRRMFQNHQEFLDLYGEATADGSVRERRFAVIGDGEVLESIRTRLSMSMLAA
ncbi:MAG: hypothetical protein C0447_10260 [Methylobacterium sp.]|jgi:hypothetical protein|nr:hypothetical protein [Methylobacterium sp.]